MGTISEKLTYLNETKGKIKDSINLTGAGITDQDTFRSYETKLKDGFVDIINNGVDTLYDNFPKVSQTGEEPTLNGVYEAPMGVDLNGNTEQTTYTGKNLLPNNSTTQTINGITFTINDDGTIIANGTSTYVATLNVPNGTLTVPAGQYKLSGCPTGGGNSTYRIDIDNGTYINKRDTGSGATFTLSEETTFQNVRVRIANDVTVNNLVFKPMVRLASITDDTYEPFVGGSPSPSPDFPQPIRVVKGNNTIKVTGKNLFDKDTMVLNALINATTGELTSHNDFRTICLKCKENTTYTIQKLASNRLVIGYSTDTDLTLPKTLNRLYTANVGTLTTLTFTTGDNAKYVFIMIAKISEYTGSINDLLDSIQIEEGSTATEYEPYQSQDYEIDLGNIELCKIGDYKDVIFKNNQLSKYYDSTLDEDSWYIKKNIGKVVLDTSNITLRSNYTNIEYAEITKPNDFIGKGNYDDYNVYCSHAVSDIKNAIQYAWDSTYRIGKITNKATTDNLWLGFPKGTGLDNVKTALNGAVVYYVLSTPTTTEITDTTLIEQLEDLKNAKSVEGQTNITQTNEELPFILDVSGLKKN